MNHTERTSHILTEIVAQVGKLDSTSIDAILWQTTQSLYEALELREELKEKASQGLGEDEVIEIINKVIICTVKHNNTSSLITNRDRLLDDSNEENI
jgi:hypothetical protein